MKKKVLILFTLITLLASNSLPSVTFSAVGQSEPSPWAKQVISELRNFGILDDFIFANYQKKITRKEFIYLAVKLYEEFSDDPIVINPAISFSDTSDEYALKGASIGITSGIGNGKFGPDEYITREQMATMLIKAIELTNHITLMKTPIRFDDDASISLYATDSVYKAYYYQFIKGSNGKFMPKDNATIEQALIIYKKIYEEFTTFSSAKNFVKDDIMDWKYTCVEFTVLKDDGYYTRGSGFFIDENTVVTNYHLFNDAAIIKIKLYKDDFIEDISILGYDEEKDILVFRTNSIHLVIDTLKLGDSSHLNIGDPIMSLGSPYEDFYSLNKGTITGFQNNKLLMDIFTSSHRSGGPVLNENAEVIGITSGQFVGNNFVEFITPIEDIINLDKSQDLTLQEFKVKPSSVLKSPSFLKVKVLDRETLSLSWENVRADYYLLTVQVNGAEYLPIVNYVDNSYYFPWSTLSGTQIYGFKSGDQLKFRVQSVVNNVVSESTESELFVNP